jgi:hypothetical protein
VEHVGLEQNQYNKQNNKELSVFTDSGRQGIRQSYSREGRESACMARLVAAWLDLPAEAQKRVAEVAGEVLAAIHP